MNSQKQLENQIKEIYITLSDLLQEAPKLRFVCDGQSPIFLSKQKELHVHATKLYDWFGTLSYFEDFSAFCQLVLLHEFGHFFDQGFASFSDLKSRILQLLEQQSDPSHLKPILASYREALMEFENKAWSFAFLSLTKAGQIEMLALAHQLSKECLQDYERQIETLEYVYREMIGRKIKPS